MSTLQTELNSKADAGTEIISGTYADNQLTLNKQNGSTVDIPFEGMNEIKAVFSYGGNLFHFTKKGITGASEYVGIIPNHLNDGTSNAINSENIALINMNFYEITQYEPSESKFDRLPASTLFYYISDDIYNATQTPYIAIIPGNPSRYTLNNVFLQSSSSNNVDCAFILDITIDNGHIVEYTRKDEYDYAYSYWRYMSGYSNLSFSIGFLKNTSIEIP